MYFYLLFGIISVRATELTFQLDERSEDCFYEELANGENSILEFQVNLFSLKKKKILIFIIDL